MATTNYLKCTLATAFLLLSPCAYAQYEYPQFVKEGKVWNMKEKAEEGSGLDVHRYQYVMQGDTVINGQAMKKVLLTDPYSFGDDLPHYVCAVKEEGHSVFTAYEGRDTLVQLYDFNLEWDFLMFDEAEGIHVESRELYLYNSIARNMQTYIGASDTQHQVVQVAGKAVEGIGFTFPIDPFRYWRHSQDIAVESCYEDGLCIYLSREYAFWIWPSYRQLLKEGRSWKYGQADNPDRTMTVMGDTIITRQTRGGIRSNIYRKIYCTGSQGDDYYYGALREEGGCVYQILGGQEPESEAELFNFTRSNDRIPIDGMFACAYIGGYDSISSKGRNYQQITLRLYDSGQLTDRYCHWIEGVGSDVGIEARFPWDMAGKQAFAVYDGDTCIYNHSDNYPLTSAIQALQFLGAGPIPARPATYDLQGRRLQTPPHKGVYISGGKKLVR